jgi:sec-independent protein translocase protein TatA
MTGNVLLIFGLGTTELLLIALVILLLFGGRKIPELMKGLGKGVKSFKDGMEGMEEELKKPSEKSSSAEQTEKKP